MRQLTTYLSQFPKVRILVVGDLMIDEFVWGKVNRISPEAPVPVVWVQSESVMPGGAANVANNIRTLGGQVSVIGLIGKDRMGEILLGELSARGIDSSHVIRLDRPTTVKTRVIAHHQQVVRFDREQTDPIPQWIVDQIHTTVAEHIGDFDAVILEDYGKGLITRTLLQDLIPLVRKHRKIITVDPKVEHVDLYHRVTAITPNRSEAGAALGRDLKDTDAVRLAAEDLLAKLECEAILITLGEDGMALCQRKGEVTLIPTVAQEVFDVAGAGDTVIATFTLALSAGTPMLQAAQLSNYAAGIVVGKLGTACVTPDELRKHLQSASNKSAGLMQEDQSRGPVSRKTRTRRHRSPVEAQV